VTIRVAGGQGFYGDTPKEGMHDIHGMLVMYGPGIERGLFPAPKMMPLAHAAEAICSVLALRGFVDEIGVMPRPSDMQVET